MHLYKSTYLPKISSSTHYRQRVNYYEIGGNDEPARTNNRYNKNFKSTSRTGLSVSHKKKLLLHNSSPLPNKQNSIFSSVSSSQNISNKTSFRYSQDFNKKDSEFKNGSSKKKDGKFYITKTEFKRVCPLCHKQLENYRFSYHFNTHPSQIFNWLYLGSYRNASDKEELKSLKITYVLNCAIECTSRYPKGIKYKHLKLCDHPSFRADRHFKEAIDFIQEARDNGANILVHCQLGISRSTTCVLAYMITKMDYNFVSAFQYVKKKRNVIMPNYGFIEQLLKYEKKLQKEKDKNSENQ